jgi:S1-C subfamily serine protease
LPGDVVTHVGETAIADQSQLLAAVAALRPLSDASITVQRGGEQLAVTITVGERPPAAQPR